MRYIVQLLLEQNLNECLYYGLQQNDENRDNKSDTARILSKISPEKFENNCHKYQIGSFERLFFVSWI